MDILQSLTDFWHNATTGELTNTQRDAIASDAVKEYTPCSSNTLLPECQDLSKQVTKDVYAATPDTGCVLSIPGFGCFKSWNTVAFSIVGVILLIVLLPTLISSAAAAAAARGR